MRSPGIDPEPSLPAYARQIRAVEDLEHQAETLLQLGLPLLEHRRRRSDHDGLRLTPQQKLSGDETCFDRLTKPGVVGDEKIDPRKPERFAQRLHLVGVDLDPGAKRRLE